MTTMLEYYKWKNDLIKDIDKCDGKFSLIDMSAASIILTDQIQRKGMTAFIRDELTITLPELGKKFDTNCSCSKINEAKNDFILPETKTKDEKTKSIYKKSGKEIIEKNKECDCGTILYLLAPFQHVSAMATKSIKPEKTIASIFMDWDDRCVCRKKGYIQPSASLGRYKK